MTDTLYSLTTARSEVVTVLALKVQACLDVKQVSLGKEFLKFQGIVVP